MLIKCPECEMQVSDKAISCPHCGYPMKKTAPHKKTGKYRRLPNGFGQIVELKNQNLRNRYRASITVGKTDEGRPIVKNLKPKAYFNTYQEAYEALVEYHKNPYELNSNLTLKDLYEKWSERHYKDLQSQSSIRSMRATWAYCHPLHNMTVSEIKIRHIKYCIEDAYIVVDGVKKEASAGTKSRMKTMLNQMLDYAVEYDIVNRNVSREFKLDQNIRSEAKMTGKDHISFTEQEMSILWDNLDVEFVDMILIQCYSGWRPQELCNLRIKDVDLDEITITGGMKTKAGRDRVVPIHRKIKELVENRVNEDSEYLFTKKGKQINYSKYSYGFGKVVKELGLNPDHRPHDCRKHFVTIAKRDGVNEYAIKYLVGHEIGDITEKIYTDRDLEWLRSEIEKIK